jgi:hypothetical protein
MRRPRDHLMLIHDTSGNVFGGFTLLEWEPGLKYKCDVSLTSFVFSRLSIGALGADRETRQRVFISTFFDVTIFRPSSRNRGLNLTQSNMSQNLWPDDICSG